MALTREKKEKIVEEFEKNVDQQKIIIFAGFKGIKNKNLSILRKDLKSVSSRITIAKKTLMKLAFKKKKIDLDESFLKGETAIIFGFNDEISPAKKVYQFSKDNPEVEIMGGFLDGSFKTSEEILELAKLASREELLSRLVGSLQAPTRNLAVVLQGNIKGLMNVLSLIKN
jgi:large subunit ribosomal protein L10